MRKKIFFTWLILMGIYGILSAGEMRVERATKEVELRGYTRSIKTATLSSEVSGKLMKIHYEIGDQILKKPFAEIDPTFIDFNIQSTKIALSKMATQLKRVQSRVAYLAKEFQRKEQLFAKGRATEVIRDAASQELEQSMLEEESVRQEQHSLTVTLKQLQEKKERHFISGPANWIVTEKMVEVGEVVQTGMPLAVIQDFRQLVVPLTVSNDELQGIRQMGDKFEAHLEDQVVTTSIYYINPDFNEQTRKIHIKLLIQDYPHDHRGGLRFLLPVVAESRGLKIPVAALVNRYENPKVFVDGIKSAVPVTVLDASDHFVTIANDVRLPIGTSLIDPKGR